MPEKTLASYPNPVLRLMRLMFAVLLPLLLLFGCATTVKPPRGVAPTERMMETTAYCDCGRCCNWKRSWLLRPVIADGPHKGERKRVGITASGVRARPGTIAADTSIYPFGTVMYVPGYGYGRVEDTGSAVRGDHIDLYFKKHRQALEWGRQTKPVQVWLSPSRH